jgi:hypothetical protein
MNSANGNENNTASGFSKPSYYRRQAEYCRQCAKEAACDSNIRDLYFQLAVQWDALASRDEPL